MTPPAKSFSQKRPDLAGAITAFIQQQNFSSQSEANKELVFASIPGLKRSITGSKIRGQRNKKIHTTETR